MQIFYHHPYILMTHSYGTIILFLYNTDMNRMLKQESEEWNILKELTTALYFGRWKHFSMKMVQFSEIAFSRTKMRQNLSQSRPFSSANKQRKNKSFMIKSKSSIKTRQSTITHQKVISPS